MPKQNKEEKEIMQWSKNSFANPWFDLCDRIQKLSQGKRLSLDEAQVDPYFVPFSLDARLVYLLMKTGGVKLIMGKNATLFTLITNIKGDELLWACIEKGDNGIYDEYKIVANHLNEKWAKDVGKLIYANKLKEAHKVAYSWVKTQKDLKHINPGAIKVANIMFFKKFKEGYEKSKNGKRLDLMGLNFISGVKEILDEDLIKFYPEINLKKLLDLIHPLLKISTPLNKASKNVLKLIPV